MTNKEIINCECKTIENDVIYNQNSKEKTCDCEVIHKEIVEKAMSEMLDEETLLFIADFFKVLADSTRVKIVNLLDNNKLCVCDISAALGMTKSAISHQLKNLREMNLVKAEREGKEVWYSLADEHVKEVFDVSAEHVKEKDDD